MALHQSLQHKLLKYLPARTNEIAAGAYRHTWTCIKEEMEENPAGSKVKRAWKMSLKR
jgi:hypothetical protein